MIRSFKSKTVALAAVGLLTVGGGAYAATSSSEAPTPLTGSITDKASEAALAKYPGGTLAGIQSRPDGSYDAQVRRADGTFVSVTLDEDFEVTATRAGGPGRGGFGGPGGRGHGGPGGFGGPRGVASADLAKALGVTGEQLRSALQKVRPERGERKDDRIAAIAKALGAKESDIEEVLQDVRGAGPGGPRGGGRGFGGGPSELIEALAGKTGRSEADVRKALRASRPDPSAKRDELATALAKELGLDAAKAKSALEAARPKGAPAAPTP